MSYSGSELPFRTLHGYIAQDQRSNVPENSAGRPVFHTCPQNNNFDRNEDNKGKEWDTEEGKEMRLRRGKREKKKIKGLERCPAT